MLNLHIINGEGPPIVGRDWIEILSLLLMGTFILFHLSKTIIMCSKSFLSFFEKHWDVINLKRLNCI